MKSSEFSSMTLFLMLEKVGTLSVEGVLWRSCEIEKGRSLSFIHSTVICWEVLRYLKAGISNQVLQEISFKNPEIIGLATEYPKDCVRKCK